MKPYNIVYFFCDELRLDALGCYGNAFTEIKTKHIDEIAKNGVLFDNCFCNSPVCVPSRMSLLTGLYPEDTGVYHNEAAIPGFQLNENYDSIPDVLQRNGYEVANFGKLHLPHGFQPFAHNDERGSSMSFASHKDITNVISPKKKFKSKIGGSWPIQEEYPCDIVSENAVEWMKEQTSPYFVRLSYLQPHTPVVVKQPYDKLYEQVKFPTHVHYEDGVSEFERTFANLIGLDSLNEKELHDMYMYYYGMVAWIDEQVGMVTKYLKESGQWDNTILVFGADHGAMRGENGCLAKQIFAPSSHRVPLLISYPNNPNKGTIDHRLCANIDLAKTLFSLLEIQCPKQFKGYNLLQDKVAPYIFASIGYGDISSRAFPAKAYGKWRDTHGWPRRACIRTDSYRLDMNVRLDGLAIPQDQEDVFFCDYKKDPQEMKNCVSDTTYSSSIQKLKEELLHHIDHAKEIDPDILRSANTIFSRMTKSSSR